MSELTPESVSERLEAYRADIEEEVADAIEAGEIKSAKERVPTPQEIAEVKEAVAELLSLGIYPKVTVDRAHLNEILQEGLRERETSYQKGVNLIVGTLGTEPFLPEGQDRVVLELHVDPKKVTPRFTGPSKRFDGVVAIDMRSVPPEMIEVIDTLQNKKKAS